MKISVCIATWNRKNKLKEIIHLLENQSLNPDEYEIIVVDSNSPDGTNILMYELCKIHSNIKYIENAKNVLAVKRNVGIENASSDIIVFIDDDVYPEYGFVEAHYNANLNNSDTFFCGQIRFPQEECEMSNYYRFRDRQHLSAKDKGRELPFNNIVVMNLSFRKEFILKVGMVDERFLGYGCEDIEFGYRIIKSGFKLKYLDSALAIHREDSSNIIMYGKKLYKSGLYGNRILTRICPEAALETSKGKRIIGYMLSNQIVFRVLGKYLLSTDSKAVLYSYILFKIYLYSCSFRGRKDQSKYSELNYEDISKGW